MSRLTDLIAQAKATDAALGSELEREFKVLSSRRSFGLNFERHRPESVELPGRPVRKGDKVHVLPPRGTMAKGDQRLWKVTGFESSADGRMAALELLYGAEVERQTVAVADLIVVAEFKDYIYPGLVSTGKVERGDDKPVHTVINGENFHVLEALTFTHRGKIDAIYIDPPYNTGAKDWKYNNDYVEGDDLYRHSKWLAMMERRLLVARHLLNPSGSVLIATIDEKEFLRLGLLLEQTFPEAKVQMISTVINPKGVVRGNEFARVNEQIFVVMIGDIRIAPEPGEDDGAPLPVNWQPLRRSDISSARHGPTFRANQFYPIYVNSRSGRIEEIGAPLARDDDRGAVPSRAGCDAVFPIRPDGTEIVWGVSDTTLRSLHARGYVSAGNRSSDKPQQWSVSYLTSGRVSDIETGKAKVVARRADGSVEAYYSSAADRAKMPTNQWQRQSHNAQHYGTLLLQTLLPKRSFPFPKSLYAIEDVLRFFVLYKKEAIVLDFFSGSGTTAHAVMRLNRQDGGNRHSISVTNNEVGVEEQKRLRGANLRPGDAEWEQWGICDYITKPRIAATITGTTPEGEPIKGDYKFTDEFPMADGFEENAEFFTLTYETPVAVSHNRAFERIAPLLWMRAGSEGRRIDKLPDRGWEVADNYGLLIDLDKSAAFAEAIKGNRAIRIAYIVTDDDRRFQSVVRQLPGSIEPVRLYESYLTNFRFAMGR